MLFRVSDFGGDFNSFCAKAFNKYTKELKNDLVSNCFHYQSWNSFNVIIIIIIAFVGLSPELILFNNTSHVHRTTNPQTSAWKRTTAMIPVKFEQQQTTVASRYVQYPFNIDIWIENADSCI